MEKHKDLFRRIYDAWDRFWLAYYECWNLEFQAWIRGEFGLNTASFGIEFKYPNFQKKPEHYSNLKTFPCSIQTYH